MIIIRKIVKDIIIKNYKNKDKKKDPEETANYWLSNLFYKKIISKIFGEMLERNDEYINQYLNLDTSKDINALTRIIFE